jgi:outer membrane protein TolC
MELLPVDAPVFRAVELEVTRSTRSAFEHRPEYSAAKAACDRQKIVVQFNRNQIWPQIDLFGTYGYNARSPLGVTTNTIQSSFSDYLGNFVDSDAPVWTVGIAVTIPLGDRQARANDRIARLQADQTLVNFKRVEQNIIIEVDNAVGKVQTNMKRLDSTRAAARLADESLKAEEQKLRAGTSTSFLVLQAQAQLAAARSAEIRARTDYDESLVNLARAEGATLRQHNITLDEKR